MSHLSLYRGGHTRRPGPRALTTEREITPAYVREHPEEFSVSVGVGQDGLIDFTIVRHAATRMYHVARLAVYHQGTLLARSDTPAAFRARAAGYGSTRRSLGRSTWTTRP